MPFLGRRQQLTAHWWSADFGSPPASLLQTPCCIVEPAKEDDQYEKLIFFMYTQ
jgi:hypothetical protein